MGDWWELALALILMVGGNGAFGLLFYGALDDRNGLLPVLIALGAVFAGIVPMMFYVQAQGG